jgi:SagB-type dehydrogenase family enzyme
VSSEVRRVFRLVLTLGPDVSRTGNGLLGATGETRLTDGPLMDALEVGASSEHLLAVGSPRSGRDVVGVLDVLMQRRLLAWRLRDQEGATLATMAPQSDGVALAAPTPEGGTLRLSRFALLRMEGESWLLESGRSPWAATLSDEAAAMIAAGVGPTELRVLLQLGGLLAESDDDGPSRYWEFHDRYFASRARRDLSPSGATFRFAGLHDPLGSRDHPPHGDEAVVLPVPDPQEAGPGIWSVTERRRSPINTSDVQVPLELLGSLLWHTLRITQSRPRDTDTSTSYDAVLRPVPSGGGTHSVGLWLWCGNVEGVRPGLWWYDPWEHALRWVGEAAHEPREPVPLHGVLISRHARLAWKYERIAHSIALKDAGVILQALQLGATALDLTLCPIGSGPTAPLLESLGLDGDEYIPVGEFWVSGA